MVGVGHLERNLALLYFGSSLLFLFSFSTLSITQMVHICEEHLGAGRAVSVARTPGRASGFLQPVGCWLLPHSAGLFYYVLAE